MVSVSLDFVAPDEPDLTSLLIYESSTASGPFVLIETVTPVGTYPDYITHYTTSFATSVSNYFAIEWEDSKGGRTAMSAAVQGGTELAIGMIVNRVLLRDPTLNSIVVEQEAEAVITSYFNVADAHDPSISPTAAELSALTYMTLARAYIGAVISASSSDSYSAGLVSQKASTSSGDKTKLIEWLLGQSARVLGTATVVMLLEDIDPTGIGATSGIEWDATRGIMTEYL